MAIDINEDVHIPVIDISSANADAARQIVDAAATYGFIFVKNNDGGIPPPEIANMFRLSKSLFDLPTEVKETCSIHSAKSGANRGWLSMHTETLDPSKQKRGDFKEAFNIGDFGANSDKQPLPGDIANERDTIGAFMDTCNALCNRVHALLAEGLEIADSDGGRDWFTTRHDRTKGACSNVLRLLYYPAMPALPDGETDIRAGAHSDYGSTTLLFQLPGQPGLEIRTPSGDSWAPVPVNPQNDEHPPILVNVGDLLSYWTAGLLKSTVHRVIFPKDSIKDRYSIAYFCHPQNTARLVEVPSPLVKEYRAKHAGEDTIGMGVGKLDEGTVLTAKAHLERRLAATYSIKAQGKESLGPAAAAA